MRDSKPLAKSREETEGKNKQKKHQMNWIAAKEKDSHWKYKESQSHDNMKMKKMITYVGRFEW